MKKLILFELILIFLATTFESDSPPGWFQQTIAIGNKQITDIYFLDSSNGWVITDWGPAFDTGYVFRTTNGGDNWNFQYRFQGSFTAIQMTNYDTGYITGSTGSGKVWKTTNGGVNWNIQFSFSANPIKDLYFRNSNTGWACSDDPISGGIFKTTNGGVNWITQTTNRGKKLSFINQDTGWALAQSNTLFMTTNGGTNWNLHFTFSGTQPNLFFTSKDTGYTIGNKTTNGGG